MRLKTMIALVTGAFALCAFPALAVAHHKESHAKGPVYAPGENGKGAQPKGKAYGFYCKGQSKKHVKGEKGTAFSRCVKAMARADRNERLAPGQACKGMSKKHVKGEKGTPFSRCVKAAAQLRKEERQKEREEAVA